MNPSTRSRTAALLALLAVLTPGTLSRAQSVVASSSSAASAASRPGANRSGDNGSSSLASVSSALASGSPLIQRGPFAVRPHLQYRFVYGDGIEAGPGNPRETSIQSIAPGTLVEIGKHWELDYTPTWTFYSNEAFRDTFDQTAGISGRYAFYDWMFSASQGYETLHTMLVETGRQTRQERLTTGVEAAYQLGRRTRIEASASRSARYANAVTDAPEWTTADWLQYSSTEWLRYYFSSQLNVAGGVTFGYADVSVGDDMEFVQPQAQFSWTPTSKITLSAQAGVEQRTFSHRNRSTLETPVYSASFSYQPFRTTKLAINASRIVSASYFANEITEGSGWSAGIEQRLVQRLYFSANYSGQDTDYIPTREGVDARRQDRYRALNLRLSTVFFQRTAVALVYQYGRNVSDVIDYEFSSHQAGIELSHRF